MKPENVALCEQHLACGKNISAVARAVDLNPSTLRKAVKRGAVQKTSSPSPPETDQGSTKTQRSRADAEASNGMGTACTRSDERIAAAIGLSESATTRFEHSRDVLMGGLLSGLPALCSNGLLKGIASYFRLPDGFYSCLHILLTLGFMALGRIRRPEGLRHIPPGEIGKVIGLDRVPEVRTLREKISRMASTGNPEGWMKELSKSWMQEDPEEAGYLYVDGHVRVYCGDKALLPRRYVSRDRLCLRGTTDYWVNDALGRPFFVVSKAVTDGLADALLTDIIPELLISVPGQPSKKELDADPLLHRFVVVFDREGANYSLLSALWEKRIGAITYRKNVKDLWPEDTFSKTEVPVPGGGCTSMKLAMRQTTLSSGNACIPVTEVRRLTKTGHQTTVISTARILDTPVIAGRMFSRWCQENFFAYMMQHYDIDGLVQYGVGAVPGTLLVVNPVWRNLDREVKKALQKVRKFAALLGMHKSLDEGGDIQKKAEYVQDMQAAQLELEQMRTKRKQIKRKVMIDSLTENQRPMQLLPLNKQLTDTVKMIAYRAETAMVVILRRHLNNEEEARALIRELFVSCADIVPDTLANTLTVRIHRMASPAHDKAVGALLDDLTKIGFCHPETGAKMIFTLV